MIPKYRAWMKSLKWMCDVTNISFDSKFVDICQQGDTERYTEMSVEFDEVKLMQSTVLKDKNCREIFEGDILAFETDDEVIKVNVFWDEEHALFMFESKKYNEQEPLAELVENNTYPFEIIGNIYENPELLEDK